MQLLLPALRFVAMCLTTWWLTGRVRRYALDRQLLDIPNARSSHSVATPRGGGIAIVITAVAGLITAAAAGVLAWRPVAGLAGGGTLVAVIGFIDDHGHLARRWRLTGHFAAAAWALACVGGFPPLHVLGVTIDFGWIGHVLAAVYVVWLLNLTNFMDGIDGIAGVEVITVTLGAMLLDVVSGGGGDNWFAPSLLAASTLGFLAWNWPPAKIFMGDAGSGFVGFLMGVFSLQAAWVAPAFLWSWLILLGVFVVDATVTLLRRALRAERFYEAHRMHAYQHAARRYAAHRPVTLVVGAINVCWLLPIALLVALGTLDGLVGLVVAYAPLVATAVSFGAGQPQVTPPESMSRHV